MSFLAEPNLTLTGMTPEVNNLWFLESQSLVTHFSHYHSFCREHLKEPSPSHAHSIQTGHNANEDNFNILGREDQGLTRLIKSIYIRVNNPTLNRDIGKFSLSHIWDRVLFNTPGLKLNNNKGQAQIQSNRPSPQPIPPWVNCRDSLSMLWIQSMCSEVPRYI